MTLGTCSQATWLSPGRAPGLQPDRRARHPVDQAVEIDLVGDHRPRPVDDVEVVEQAAGQDRAELLQVLRLVEQRAADDGVRHQDRRGERDRGRARPTRTRSMMRPAVAAAMGIDHAQQLGDAVAVVVGADVGHDQPQRPLAVALAAERLPLGVVEDALVALRRLGRQALVGAQIIDLFLCQAELDQVGRGDALDEAQERRLVFVACAPG